MPAPSQVYLAAIGPPALNAALVILILPKPSSPLEGLPGLVDVFAAGGVEGVVVDCVVVVDDLEDFEAGGLAAVEVVVEVVGVVGVVGPVAVVAAVVVEVTLADPPPDPPPQPAIVTTAHRHAATPANHARRDTPPLADRSCPSNLRPMSPSCQRSSDIRKVGTIQVRRHIRAGRDTCRIRSSADLGRQLDLGELHLADQPPRLARVDQTGPKAGGGLRAAGHSEAQTLIGSARFVARGEIPR
jgi:hypothetical protein